MDSARNCHKTSVKDQAGYSLEKWGYLWHLYSLPCVFWMTELNEWRMNEQADGTIFSRTVICMIWIFVDSAHSRVPGKRQAFSYENLSVENIYGIYSYTSACCKSASLLFEAELYFIQLQMKMTQGRSCLSGKGTTIGDLDLKCWIISAQSRC